VGPFFTVHIGSLSPAAEIGAMIHIDSFSFRSVLAVPSSCPLSTIVSKLFGRRFQFDSSQLKMTERSTALNPSLKISSISAKKRAYPSSETFDRRLICDFRTEKWCLLKNELSHHSWSRVMNDRNSGTTGMSFDSSARSYLAWKLFRIFFKFFILRPPCLFTDLLVHQPFE
jgi:hypothetical protein